MNQLLFIVYANQTSIFIIFWLFINLYWYQLYRYFILGALTNRAELGHGSHGATVQLFAVGHVHDQLHENVQLHAISEFFLN